MGVPKSVTLNDFERRNGRYFALLHDRRYILTPTASNSLKLDLYLCDKNVHQSI